MFFTCSQYKLQLLSAASIIYYYYYYYFYYYIHIMTLYAYHVMTLYAYHTMTFYTIIIIITLVFYKVALLVYKWTGLHWTGPAHLTDYCTALTLADRHHQLRSVTRGGLILHRTRTKRIGP